VVKLIENKNEAGLFIFCFQRKCL